MEEDISTCIEIYKNQLIQGSIRRAYMLLTRYMRELKAKFPEPYLTGNISLGYLDYTYFPFFNSYLRQHKLRFGIVLRSCIHKRLSKVWKWEILTIASAEEREIS